jgi:hypothetical protein
VTGRDDGLFDVEEWFVQLDSGELGPLDVQAIRDLVAAGRATGQTMVKRGPDDEWSRLDRLVPVWGDLAPRRAAVTSRKRSLGQNVFLLAVVLVVVGFYAAWQWHASRVQMLPAGTYVDVDAASDLAYRTDGPPPRVLRLGGIDHAGVTGNLGVLPGPGTAFMVDGARVPYATFVGTWLDSGVATVVVGSGSRLLSIDAPVHSPSEVWSRRLN